MKTIASALSLILLGTSAGAHPHIFIDTGVDLVFDDGGQLTEVKVTWVYDEFYSLLITEDYGLDQDFNGVLTAEELATLQGFDMNWVEGFNGDLVIRQGQERLSLSGPQEPTASFADGRITTTHVRKVTPYRFDGTDLAIKPYDPTYYTAYDVSGPITLEGSDDCSWRVEEPDLEATLAKLRDILDALDDDTKADDPNLPDVGGLLASTVVVTCDIS